MTGTRADFGKLKPLIQEVKKAPGFQYQLFVTGMHLLQRYGLTVNEIRKAGFTRVFPFFNQNDGINIRMDQVLANTVQGFGRYVREFQPDLIVVHGDRVEALAGAIVGALNNILVAHIEGGEVSGTVDEIIRHAVTKLSHVHFTANEQARTRLIQMGEPPEEIFVIGSPDIDVMLSKQLPSLAQVRRKYRIPFEEYAIFLYHPVTTELAHLQKYVHEIFSALEDSQQNFVAFFPNNDPGSELILNELLRLEKNDRFRILPSMRFEYFLTLLKKARFIIGNSIAGIREAPVYGIPALNIGSRQRNRFHHRSIKNIPEKKEVILEAMKTVRKPLKPNHHFGTGNSAEKFIDILKTKTFWEISPQKQFCDIPISFLSSSGKKRKSLQISMRKK